MVKVCKDKFANVYQMDTFMRDLGVTAAPSQLYAECHSQVCCQVMCEMTK